MPEVNEAIRVARVWTMDTLVVGVDGASIAIEHTKFRAKAIADARLLAYWWHPHEPFWGCRWDGGTRSCSGCGRSRTRHGHVPPLCLNSVDLVVARLNWGRWRLLFVPITHRPSIEALFKMITVARMHMNRQPLRNYKVRFSAPPKSGGLITLKIDDAPSRFIRGDVLDDLEAQIVKGTGGTAWEFSAGPGRWPVL